MYYVYILQSIKGKHFYIGVSHNPETRLKKHNDGSSSSTAPYRPWKIIFLESYTDKNEVYKREYYLKSPAGYKDKISIIQTHQSDHGEIA